MLLQVLRGAVQALSYPSDSGCFELGVCSCYKMGVPDVIGGPLPTSLSHQAVSAVMGAPACLCAGLRASLRCTSLAV